VIKIEGGVDRTLLDSVGSLDLASVVEDSGRMVTTLSGLVIDQSGLVGLIRHLHGLGLVLLSIERVPAR
jgi:hypothetical protein